MNLSISQSKITELTGKLSRFTQEVDDFGDGMIDKGSFLRDVQTPRRCGSHACFWRQPACFSKHTCQNRDDMLLKHEPKSQGRDL